MALSTRSRAPPPPGWSPAATTLLGTRCPVFVVEEQFKLKANLPPFVLFHTHHRWERCFSRIAPLSHDRSAPAPRTKTLLAEASIKLRDDRRDWKPPFFTAFFCRSLFASGAGVRGRGRHLFQPPPFSPLPSKRYFLSRDLLGHEPFFAAVFFTAVVFLVDWSFVFEV